MNANELSQERTNLSMARSHLSNERTLLSILRTGIALISFGITLNRFSLYLIQNERSGLPSRNFLHDTKNVGLGMVIVASFLLIWAIKHFIETAKEIDTLSFRPAKWSLVIFTIVVILFSATMTILMIRS
jgi:putative membrane protein